MTPGPDLIRKCSKCGALFRQFTLGSGNTFGATFWSDGKLQAPMLPDQPWLVRCPQCSALVWVDEQEMVASVNPFPGNDDAFGEALDYLEPAASDYERVAPEWAGDRKKHRYLRQRAWWAANDDRRKREDPAPFSEAEARNLEALVALLDEPGDKDRIMQAEALRELGRFDEALRLLARSVDPKYQRTAAFIKELATKGDVFVRAIK